MSSSIMNGAFSSCNCATERWLVSRDSVDFELYCTSLIATTALMHSLWNFLDLQIRLGVQKMPSFKQKYSHNNNSKPGCMFSSVNDGHVRDRRLSWKVQFRIWKKRLCLGSNVDSEWENASVATWPACCEPLQNPDSGYMIKNMSSRIVIAFEPGSQNETLRTYRARPITTQTIVQYSKKQ